MLIVTLVSCSSILYHKSMYSDLPQEITFRFYLNSILFVRNVHDKTESYDKLYTLLVLYCDNHDTCTVF